MYRVKTFQELTDEGATNPNNNNNNNNNTFQDLDTFDKKNSVAGTLTTMHHIDDKPKNFSISRTETKKKSTMRPNSAKKSSQNVLDVMEIQDLDNIFAKFIDEKLRQKNQTKPMERIQEEFLGIMKDEDFDKKEFDFSKKMLRLKKKYPLPRYNDQPYPSEPLNRIKEHTEIIGQAMNINIESGVSNYLQKQREAQKELEKEQIAQNIYHSTIILQNKIEEEDLKPKSPAEGKNKLQSILLKKQEFHLKKTKKEIEFRQPTAERLESFAKFDIIENAESKKKQQEKLAQHHKTLFLNLVDSYERELEVIDKQMATASKTSANRNVPSSSERSYLNITRGKSFMKTDKLKFVKHNLDLANSTNLLSLRVQAAKQKNVGFADLVNFKIKGSSTEIKMKEKKKERSPVSKSKSRYQVSFDYAKVVESTMLWL